MLVYDIHKDFTTQDVRVQWGSAFIGKNKKLLERDIKFINSLVIN